jgi:hypothetical protein
MKLRRWQAERLSRAVGPMLRYLYRLNVRAEQRLDPSDPVSRAVK